MYGRDISQLVEDPVVTRHEALIACAGSRTKLELMPHSAATQVEYAEKYVRWLCEVMFSIVCVRTSQAGYAGFVPRAWQPQELLACL